MKIIFLSAFLLLASLAAAETSGTINASANNFSAPVVGLFGHTVEHCDVDASCLGYKCFVDFDGEVDDSNTGKPSGTCMPPTTNQCFHDTRWYGPGTNVRNSNVTYYTCLSNETGKWSLASCDSGKTFDYSTTTEAGNCTTSSSSSSSSGGSSSSTNATTKKAAIAITSSHPDIQMTQGDSAIINTNIKNTGNTTLSAVKMSVSGGEGKWFSVTPESMAVLGPGNTNTFTINITLPPDATINTYSVSLKLSAQDGTNDTKTFSLKVVPASSAQSDINQSYESYKFILDILEANVSGLSNVNKEDLDSLSTTVTLARSKLDEAKASIEKSDYYSAKLLLDEVANLIDSANRQLARVRPAQSEEPQPLDLTLIAIIAAVVAGVAIFLTYLLWPAKESTLGFGKK